MLTSIATLLLGFAAFGLVAGLGLSAAAPKRTRVQPFKERVASGAASLMMKGVAAGYDARVPSTGGDSVPVLVSVTFRALGDLEAFARKMDGFAPFLSNTPGLVWKVWTLDRETRDGSGTYLFETRRAAEMYLTDILPEGMGDVPYIINMKVQVLPVMSGPSQVTHAALAA